MAYRTKQKEEAVKLANKIGLSKAAKQTNISIAALWAWKNSQEFAYLRNDSTANPLDENEKRIRELEQENEKIGQDSRALLDALALATGKQHSSDEPLTA